MLNKIDAKTPNQEAVNVKIPSRFICKITNEIMSDPVVAPDGFTYEHEAILEALRQKPESPMTREVISIEKLTLIPNRDLKSDIKEFLQQYPHLYATDVYLSKASKRELISAIQEGNQTTVENLLNDTRLLVQPLKENNLTALHIACETKYIEMMLIIIKRLLDKNQLRFVLSTTKINDWKPEGLFNVLAGFVIDKNNEALCKVMEEGIKLVFDVNTLNGKNQTLVHIALATDNLKMVEYLVSLGFKNWHVIDQDGKSCLHSAIKSKSLKNVEMCLVNGMSVYSVGHTNRTVLFDAIAENWYEGVVYLLDKGIPVNQPDTQGRQTMHWVAQLPNASSALINVLLKKEADINTPDKNKVYPIHLAAQQGNLALLQVVQDKIDILTCVDDKDNQPIHYAAKAGQEAFAKQLIHLKVNLEALNQEGQTPYQLATQEECTSVIALIDNYQQSKTKLIQAIQKNDLHTLMFLLEEYPYLLYYCDEKGKSVYLLACEANDIEIIKFVQKMLDKNLSVILSQIPTKHRTTKVIIATLEAALTRLDLKTAQWCLSFNPRLYPIEPVTVAMNFSLPGSVQTINKISLTDNGNIVTWFQDGTAKIWDHETGHCLSILKRSEKINPYHHYHDQDKNLKIDRNIFFQKSQDVAEIWDSQTGKCLMALQKPGNINGISLTMDGNIITWSQEFAKVWNKEGDCLFTIANDYKKTGTSFSGLTLAPNGNIILWLGGTAQIWDSQGQFLVNLQGQHTHNINALIFVDKENFVTWSEYDQNAMVWNSQSGQCLFTLRHTSDIGELMLTPKGHILTWSKGGIIKIWNSQSGQCRITFQTSENAQALSITDNSNVVTRSSGDIKVWDSENGQCLFTLSAQNSFNCDSLPNGNFIRRSRNLAEIWNGHTKKRLFTLDLQRLSPYESPKNSHIYDTLSLNQPGIVYTDDTKNIKIWDTNSGQDLITLQLGYGDQIKIFFELPNKNMALWTENNGTSKIGAWDRETGHHLFSVSDSQDDKIQQLSLTPEGNMLITSSKNKKIWDGKSGQCLATLENKGNKIFSFSQPNSQLSDLKSILTNEFVFHALSKTPFLLEDKTTLLECLNLFKFNDYLGVNAQGQSLIHVASETGNIPLIDFLLNKKISIELSSQNSRQEKILSYSTAEVDYEHTYTTSPSSETDLGNTCPKTPLHYAILGNQPECVRYLIKKGADIGAIDHAGKSPLQLAAAYGREECAEILLSHGARQDVRHPTPKIIASATGHHATADILYAGYIDFQRLSDKLLKLEEQQEKLVTMMTLIMQKLLPELDTGSLLPRQQMFSPLTTYPYSHPYTFFPPAPLATTPAPITTVAPTSLTNTTDTEIAAQPPTPQ